MIPKPLFQAFAAFVFLLFVFVTALILGGCGPDSPSFQAGDGDEVGKMIRAGGLRYAQDTTSGHCFAYAFVVREYPGDRRGDIGGAVITWVPCEAARP